MKQLAWVGIAAGVLGACIPDETGYGNDTGPRGEDPPTFDGETAEDDGLGGSAADASGLFYAADAPLGDVAVDVTVIAPAGTFGAAAVDVAIEGGAAADRVLSVDGGLVAALRGRGGDLVVVSAGGQELASVFLAPGSSGAPAEAADSAGTDLPLPPLTDGAVVVTDGTLGVPAPALAWNEDRGGVAIVDLGSSVPVPAQSGDVVCLASTGAAEALSSPVCDTVP